jgi:hypothetical protein
MAITITTAPTNQMMLFIPSSRLVRERNVGMAGNVPEQGKPRQNCAPKRQTLKVRLEFA